MAYITSMGTNPIMQPGQYTVEQCANICRQTSPAMGMDFCWGFDYIEADLECAIHLEDYVPMSGAVTVTNYRRIFQCVRLPSGKNPFLMHLRS